MKESVILDAQKRTLSKIEAKRRKARTGPVTVNNVIITFNNAFKDFDFGEFPPLVTGKTQKMLLGWISIPALSPRDRNAEVTTINYLDRHQFFEFVV